MDIFCFNLSVQEFRDERYLRAAVECGEVVWKRGLLKKGYELCHGVAGNAYTFLQLYRLTGQQEYLNRTVKVKSDTSKLTSIACELPYCMFRMPQFAEWCLTSSERETRTPDTPFSLFEGQ